MRQLVVAKERSRIVGRRLSLLVDSKQDSAVLLGLQEAQMGAGQREQEQEQEQELQLEVSGQDFRWKI